MVPKAHAKLVRTVAREARLQSDEGDYGGAEGESTA